MHLLRSILSVGVLAFVGAATAAPAPSDSSSACRCSNPLVRREWRTLSSHQQLEYVSAVQCLIATPGKTQDIYDGVRSRFDDFQALHIDLAARQLIHMVGSFLPWHRMYLALFETELRNTCGYTGAQPYWDWSLDVIEQTDFLQSPVFDPVHGFGGNGAYIADVSNLTQTSGVPVPGRSGGGCVTDGPFANMTVNMGGASTAYVPHCLRRDVAPEFAARVCSAAEVDWTLSAGDFATFDMSVEALNLTLEGTTTHSCGHWGVGGQVGEIGDVYSSPADPIFYLHHANLDLIWDRWQKLDWNTRKTEIGGPDVAGAFPYNFFGDLIYSNVTLDDVLDMGRIGGNLTISRVMDTQAGALCYTYDIYE